MSIDGRTAGRDGRLRVAFVVSSLEVGGLQRAISTIARNLDPQRAVMEVIALRRPSRASTVMYDELGAAGVAVHDLRVTGRAERDPRALVSAVAGLRRLFVAQRYDVVDSAVLEADLASRLATVRLRTQHVTHLINLTHDPRAMHRRAGAPTLAAGRGSLGRPRFGPADGPVRRHHARRRAFRAANPRNTSGEDCRRRARRRCATVFFATARSEPGAARLVCGTVGTGEGPRNGSARDCGAATTRRRVLTHDCGARAAATRGRADDRRVRVA